MEAPLQATRFLLLVSTAAVVISVGLSAAPTASFAQMPSAGAPAYDIVYE